MSFQNKENVAISESVRHYQGLHVEYSKQLLKKKKEERFAALQTKYAFYQDYLYKTLRHFLAIKNRNYS